MRTTMKSRVTTFMLALAFVWHPIAHAAQAQRTFASPEEAVAALVAGLKAFDRNELLAILGKDAGSWIGSGDSVADRATARRFVDDYEQQNAVKRDGDRAALTVGQAGYEFAFPVVKAGERWRFDTAAGKEEMLARRIGANELDAIETLRAIVDAQLEYASEDRDGNGTLEYAQRLASSPGKRDGLYWPTKSGEALSPLGPLVATAAEAGYSKGAKPQPYHGYYFRMLRGQGSDASTGALDYVVRKRAIGGFAVVAWPARYGNSGVMTFIVNHEGVVYERDLGPDTHAVATAMKQYNPGKGWTRVASQR